MNCQVKDLLLQKCLEVEQTAREQATDNAILDQISKVTLQYACLYIVNNDVLLTWIP